MKKKCPATNAQAVKNLDMLADAFNLVCANVVRKAGEDFEALLKKGLKEETAYEECCKLSHLSLETSIIF